MSLRRRASALLGAVALSLGLVAALAPPGANAQPKAKPVTNAALINYLHANGYLPLHGLATLQRAKAYAAAHAGQFAPASAPAQAGAAPTIGASWQGINDPTVSPPDTNGAIGPNSYVEIINLQIAIYTRSGGLTSAGTLGLLTGHSQFNLSDPMVLWDPDTQRFFYNVWDVAQSTMAWGFSKDSNPTTIPASFCNYTASFGYNPSTDIPDYPKLGQTKGFLLIGVNHYPSFSSMHADRSDVLWISKPQGQSPVTTCPAASTFTTGKFINLKNSDGSQAFTPVPAIQTDPSATGFVTTMSDIECPDICGTGTKITVHAVRGNPHNPAVPQLLTTGHSITVPGFTSPPNAPQNGTTNVLDTLDGRLTHAVSGIDPSHSNKLAIWVAHTVAGGAGSQINWYEINPFPVATPTLFQSGIVSDPSLYVFNAGISNDRMVVASGTGSHGDAMVLGFSTSSSSTFPAAQMVSKIGTGAQSAFVLVDQSATFDNDFTCTTATGNGCRWGDYGGATPDPAAPAGAHGEAWCTNEHVVTIGKSNGTWNWEAKP